MGTPGMRFTCEYGGSVSGVMMKIATDTHHPTVHGEHRYILDGVEDDAHVLWRAYWLVVREICVVQLIIVAKDPGQRDSHDELDHQRPSRNEHALLGPGWWSCPLRNGAIDPLRELQCPEPGSDE